MKDEKTRYIFWKWIITAGLAVIVFFAGWFAGDLFDLIKGNVGAEIDKSREPLGIVFAGGPERAEITQRKFAVVMFGFAWQSLPI